MSIHVQSLGELTLSRGFFDFTWLETPVFEPVVGVDDTPTWLDPEIFEALGVSAASSPTTADTPVGPTAPPSFDAADVADFLLIDLDAAVSPDAPLEEVRWTDPFFDVDIRPGGEGRIDQQVFAAPDAGVWMTNPWGAVDFGFDMIYAVKLAEPY